MTYLAWDLETCPLPTERLAPAQQERLESEIGRLSDRKPELGKEAAARQAGSFHPHLGWICCISAVRGGPGAAREPTSWVAASPEEEEDMLDRFWADVHRMGRHFDCNGEELRWVTFNGKSFDVPFLTARTVANGLAPTRNDLTDTYPYSNDPHADLMGLWREPSYSLEGLCIFLGVDSPKEEGVDGSDVAGLVEEGDLGRVAAYCERDALATLRCAQEASVLL